MVPYNDCWLMMFSYNERFVLFFCSCHCDMYVSAEELCNSSCVSTLPVLSARLDTDGQLVLRIKAADESKTWSRVRSGPDNSLLCITYYTVPLLGGNLY